MGSGGGGGGTCLRRGEGGHSWGWGLNVLFGGRKKYKIGCRVRLQVLTHRNSGSRKKGVEFKGGSRHD